MDQNPMTAHDLLLKVLDYTYLWASPDRRDSKPAMVRLSQIEALQKGFGLTKANINPFVKIVYSFSGNKEHLERSKYLEKLTNLEYLLKGEFLKDREADANKELIDNIVLKVSSLYPGMAPDNYRKRGDIHWLFNNLLNFRQEIYKVTYPNGGMLEGFSSGLHYSFYLQDQLKQIIGENLGEIDKVLSLILDPYKREVRKQDIDYPDADLEKMDLEWRMENY